MITSISNIPGPDRVIVFNITMITNVYRNVGRQICSRVGILTVRKFNFWQLFIPPPSIYNLYCSHRIHQSLQSRNLLPPLSQFIKEVNFCGSQGTVINIKIIQIAFKRIRVICVFVPSDGGIINVFNIGEKSTGITNSLTAEHTGGKFTVYPKGRL